MSVPFIGGATGHQVDLHLQVSFELGPLSHIKLNQYDMNHTFTFNKKTYIDISSTFFIKKNVHFEYTSLIVFATNLFYVHEVQQLAVVLPEFGTTRGICRIGCSLKGRTFDLFILLASFCFFM